MHEPKIKAVLNGWIVEVGCQTLVFTDKDEMLHELDRYLCHPDEMEKEYLKGSINSDVFGCFATSNPIGMEARAYSLQTDRQQENIRRGGHQESTD